MIRRGGLSSPARRPVSMTLVGLVAMAWRSLVGFFVQATDAI